MENANLWPTRAEDPESTAPAEPERPAVAARPQPRLKPINRQQRVLRPVDVEQLVEADHPVRAIWELMGRLLPESFWRRPVHRRPRRLGSLTTVPLVGGGIASAAPTTSPAAPMSSAAK